MQLSVRDNVFCITYAATRRGWGWGWMVFRVPSHSLCLTYEIFTGKTISLGEKLCVCRDLNANKFTMNCIIISEYCLCVCLKKHAPLGNLLNSSDCSYLVL